ncbi:Endothelin-converting enzyme homolog [Gryllus bimaculatus]|nr:Endothelin-converting enzyme homolog [Gryllus bimaculatus]
MADISWAFEASLRAQRWLDAQTRDAALRKVRAVRMLVGGPPHLADWFDTDEYYANLTLHDDTFLDDLLAIIDFRYNKKLQRLHNKHHLTE